MSINLNIGAEYKLYVGASAPPATEVQLAESVGFSLNHREVSKALRDGTGFYRKRLGFSEWTVNVSVVEDSADTAWALLETLALSKERIYFKSTDPSGHNLEGSGFIQSWEPGQDNEEIVTTSLTIMVDGEIEATDT